MASLFFSYSHADETWRDKLEKHLSALKHQGVIEVWHDRRITAGQDFGAEIDANLNSADVILLLVSSDFLASNYCYNLEMKQAMKRHEQREATVIPVIVRPCDCHDTPFGRLQATPKDGRAITLWPNEDEAFLDVVTAIKRALSARDGRQKTSESLPAAVAPAPSAGSSLPRSSNLRVSKKFSDYDKDKFQSEAFDYIAKFFEGSLEELAARNPGLDKSFKRVDANRFTAAAYRDGRKVCRCTVYVGGIIGGIAYVMDDNANLNSMNESLQVETDDQGLYLKSLGMQAYGRAADRLSFEGAAELYWAMFVEPLQR